MTSYHPVPLVFERKPPAEMNRRARAFADAMQTRRSVRSFAPDPFPEQVLFDAVRAASSAPSGAHQQPWTFVIVTDAELKLQIRSAAEEEEKKLWNDRMSDEWRTALDPLGLDWHKPHLTEAPALIVVFAQSWGIDDTERRVKHYYVSPSASRSASC